MQLYTPKSGKSSLKLDLNCSLDPKFNLETFPTAIFYLEFGLVHYMAVSKLWSLDLEWKVCGQLWFCSLVWKYFWLYRAPFLFKCFTI